MIAVPWWGALILLANVFVVGAVVGQWDTGRTFKKLLWRQADESYRAGFEDGFEHGKGCGYDDAVLELCSQEQEKR